MMNATGLSKILAAGLCIGLLAGCATASPEPPAQKPIPAKPTPEKPAPAPKKPSECTANDILKGVPGCG